MICSAIVSLTFSATGIGWYGDPVQQGWETPRVQSLTFSRQGLVRHVQQRGEPGEDRLAVVAGGLGQLHHVHRDGHRRLVVH